MEDPCSKQDCKSFFGESLTCNECHNNYHFHCVDLITPNEEKLHAYGADNWSDFNPNGIDDFWCCSGCYPTMVGQSEATVCVVRCWPAYG